MTNKNSTYKRLGDYIREINVRNKDLSVTKLMGINIDKYFMPSVANVIGTDMSNYKVVANGQFACNLMHVGRDEKIPVALNTEDPIIVSPAYFVFEVCDDSLLPEYLELSLRNPEFDRNAWFHTDGDVRGGMDKEGMKDLLIPVPSLEEQRSIVSRYKAIETRISNNKQTIAKLEEAAQALYRKMFVDDVDVENLPDGWRMGCLGEVAEIKGGKRLPLGTSLTKEKNKHPYIKIADMKGGRFIALDNNFEYVSDEVVYNQISRYIVHTSDILLSIVGTIGIVSIVDDSLNGANQTENCVKITKFKDNLLVSFTYQYLVSNKGQSNIEQATVGAVQKKLPLYNIQSLPILIPNDDQLKKFNGVITPIASYIKRLTIEQNKLTEMLSLVMA